MRSLSAFLTALLATTTVLATTHSDIDATTCIASPSNASVWGNAQDYWIQSSKGWDLTRSQLFGSTPNTTRVIPVHGTNSPIIIDTRRTALVMIDVQNFFLHPAVASSSVGRDIVPTIIETVKALRKSGIKILWTQWGLDPYDLRNLPPAFLRGFGNTPSTSFGSEMGIINGTNWGRKLMRGAFNAQAWGDLYPLQVEGIKNGTDLLFHKNRLSGMWGVKTPLELYLQEHDITTLFFGGVNTDQCVLGTALDAYYKGYDVILVDDISATTSPLFATQMVDYNVGLDGWTANSTTIIPALN